MTPDIDFLHRVAVCNLVLGVSRRPNKTHEEYHQREGYIVVLTDGYHVLTPKGARALIEAEHFDDGLHQFRLDHYIGAYDKMIEALKAGDEP